VLSVVMNGKGNQMLKAVPDARVTGGKLLT